MGILGIFLFGFILGPLAIIFGATAWSRDRDGFGLAGLILGLVGFILWILAFIYLYSIGYFG